MRDPLDHLDLLAPQVSEEALAPPDPLDLPADQVPKDHQDLLERKVFLEKRVLSVVLDATESRAL